MSVTVLFLPDRVTATAEPGEPLLDVASRAGITIPTYCLKGACMVCKVAIEGQENPVRACITTVPDDDSLAIVHCYPKANLN
jgi:ferredoxin